MKYLSYSLSLGLCLSPVVVASAAPTLPALPRSSGPPAAVVTAEDYHLGPGDGLLIRVARHEEMSAEVVVLDDGKIMVPRVGELQVADRTVAEVHALITEGLQKTLLHPEVSVTVTQPRPRFVYVSGVVHTPHAIPMATGWRVSEALAEAGGLMVKPERARATLFRRPNQTIPLDLARIFIQQDSEANLPLQPGDNLDIQEEPTTRVYVSGAVLKNGPVELPKGSGISEAIALAGGVTPLAAPSRTQVHRHSGERIPVDLNGVLNQGKPAPDIKLEGDDEIIIPENRERVSVLGFVKNAGAFPLHDGMKVTVAEAVSMAGGPVDRARLSHVGIIRVVDGQSKVIPVDLKNVLRSGNAEQNPILQDQDIVFVPETDRPDWTKIIPGAQALGSLWYFVKH